MQVQILIADDNATYRKALRNLLEGVDHWCVLEARDGKEAIAKAIESRPAVIILDLAMPGKDGLTAAREISQLLPQIPILMCTMHWAPHIETEALKSGIRKVLSKSDSSLLVPAVRQVLAPEAKGSEVPLTQAIPPPGVPKPELAASPIAPATAADAAADPPAPSLPTLPKNVA